jgi:chromosome segregation ATPase
MEKLAAEHASLEGENRQLHGELGLRVKEIEEWKLSCSRLEGEINRLKELNYRVEELQNKLRSQQAEYERLGQALRGKVDEAESWKMRFEKVSSEMAKYRNVDSQLEEAENKITLLSTEIQRLNQVLLARMNELDQWKSKCGKLELTAKNMAGLE